MSDNFIYYDNYRVIIDARNNHRVTAYFFILAENYEKEKLRHQTDESAPFDFNMGNRVVMQLNESLMQLSTYVSHWDEGTGSDVNDVQTDIGVPTEVRGTTTPLEILATVMNHMFAIAREKGY